MAAQWLTLPGSAGAREQEERYRLGRFQLTPWCRQFERTSLAVGLEAREETHPLPTKIADGELGDWLVETR